MSGLYNGLVRVINVINSKEECLTSKVHSFGDRILQNKYLFSFRKDRFFKAVKPRQPVRNDIVFAQDKFNVRFELLIIVEPANDTVRSGVVCDNIEMFSVNVQSALRNMVQNSVKTMTMERSSLSPAVYFNWASLSLYLTRRPQVYYLVQYKLSFDNQKHQCFCERFIAIRVCKKATLYHKPFHAFEGQIKFGGPTKGFLSSITGERCENVCVLRPHEVTVIDSTQKLQNL